MTNELYWRVGCFLSILIIMMLLEWKKPARLSPIAARVVLTCLYLARHNRPEIYWTVNNLARNVTKWSQADDKRLHRLISFMHHNKDCVQFCYVGDHVADCILVLFCDAGFAGDLKDSKSTGGSFCFLLGKNSKRILPRLVISSMFSIR